jgi:hypothetical protein
MPTGTTTTGSHSGARHQRAHRRNSSPRPPPGSPRPPHVGGRGRLGVYLDVDDVDWDEIGEIVLDAYRVIAPRKLTALLD